MDKHTQPKRKISRSLLLGTLLMLLLLGVGLGVLGSTTYSKGMMDRYQAHLQSLLWLAESQIDVDDLAVCIETGRESEKYEKAQAFLDCMKNTCDIKYVYVVKPLNTEPTDNMMNVIAGVSDLERELYSDILAKLGGLTGSDYSAEVAQMYLARMDRSSEITYYSNTTQFGYMYTGLMPLHNKNGDPVAILAIDIEMDEIHRTRRNYNLITGASVLILAVLSFGFTYFWLRRRIIQPIVKLQTASTNFVTSSRNTQDPEDLRFEKPDIHTHDEMEELSDALLSMSEDMKRYMKTLVVDTAEKERISAEFNVAKQIQNDIMPSVFPAFPERGDFDIYAIMESSREIGGDFYDFFLVDDDHLAMVVGNVSGRGIPAALFMVIVKTLVKNRALQGFSPAEVMQSVSEQLLEGNRAEMFSTVWLAVVELSTGKGMASNAGHRHPILCRAGKKFELQVYRHTPPVGAMEGIRFRDHGFQLDPGDTLVVYTDGVTDAINEQEEMFGTDHILEALNREPEATPSVLLQTLKASVDRFSGTMPQIDDITMLALKYYGPGQTGQAK
ncbi:MAG: hypothetical protein E7425_00475 [Ruminococcaceae bacterium]|jgi:sigma-B regulation protein RsbU (phosphoserine phosphatase)|nr:hypothetical protein [Oscillospiraceae bacterium]